ncbi:hypothetical protein O181_105592 [Austropuccinia psidii MF-1]|uniref:Uncharacterized protein n=1 Tax=Austropuccinia psidii MF-1 TaxID=1389203 RepID=A0A9Q3JQC4_9BASI|nr:hypothetical protein [Austropuccinia psidii MF-1]
MKPGPSRAAKSSPIEFSNELKALTDLIEQWLKDPTVYLDLSAIFSRLKLTRRVLLGLQDDLSPHKIEELTDISSRLAL